MVLKILTSACLLIAATLGGSVDPVMAGDDGYDWNDDDYSITGGAEIVVVTPKLNVRECASRKGKECKAIGAIKQDTWHVLTGKTETVTAPNNKAQQWLELKYRLPMSKGGQWAPTAWIARKSTRTGNKLVLVAEEGDGFSWRSCATTSDAVRIRQAPDEQAPVVMGGVLRRDDRLVIVYAMNRVKDGRTWWPVARKYCDDAQTRCDFIATGWASDQHAAGATSATFLCEGSEGYNTELAAVPTFNFDYNVIFSGLNDRRR